MWTTTGNLTNVRTNAKFDFGVAMLPAGKQRGSPTGGGNFYLFKKSTPAQREAAFKFIKWVTTPQRAAQWGIDTGYVAVRADAWDTPAMKQYVGRLPARRRRPRPAAVREGRALDPRQPARDQGAERRPAGRADRHQDARAGDEGRAARGRAAAAQLQVTSAAFGRPARLVRTQPCALPLPAGGESGADVPPHDAQGRVDLRLAAAAAGGGAARAVHALPGGGHRVAQLPLDAQGRAAGGVRRASTTTGSSSTTRSSGRRCRTTSGSRSARSRPRSRWRC